LPVLKSKSPMLRSLLMKLRNWRQKKTYTRQWTSKIVTENQSVSNCQRFRPDLLSPRPQCKRLLKWSEFHS
jgi:hypothetical protein